METVICVVGLAFAAAGWDSWRRYMEHFRAELEVSDRLTTLEAELVSARAKLEEHSTKLLAHRNALELSRKPAAPRLGR